MSAGKKDSNVTDKILLWALGGFLAIETAITSFTVTQLLDLSAEVNVVSKEVVAIKATRFTIADGVALKDATARVDKSQALIIYKVDELSNRLARLEASRWTMKDYDSLRKRDNKKQ